MTDRELRLLGPHLLDARTRFQHVPISIPAWKDLATPVVKQGRGPGSLEPEHSAGLDYLVVDRDTIVDRLPELYAAYVGLAPLVSKYLGIDVVPSLDRGAININIVEGGGRYEWHTDSQPWTLLLFVTEHPFDGDLVVDHPIGGHLRFGPKLGQAVLFDGQKLPHAVNPVGDIRVTIPMVFVDAQVGDVRPEGTDDYLYEAGHKPVA